MTAHVSVLFDLPTRIAKGLADGVMTRRGGVIQWATGDAKGEVVAWLRESGGLQSQLREGVPLPANVASQLSAVGAGLNVMMGLQVLTLASVAIGFAVINSKLKVLDGKLDTVLRELSALREDVSWLDRRQDIGVFARLGAALESAAWAERTGRLEALASQRSVLLESEHHFAGLLSAMTANERALHHPQLYSTYHAGLSLAGVGRAQLDGVLDGASVGAATVVEVERKLRDARDAFQKPLREFDANARAMLRLPSRAASTLEPAVHGMKELEGRVSGYETELAFCARNELPLEEWRSLGADESRPQVLVLEPFNPTPQANR